MFRFCTMPRQNVFRGAAPFRRIGENVTDSCPAFPIIIAEKTLLENSRYGLLLTFMVFFGTAALFPRPETLLKERKIAGFRCDEKQTLQAGRGVCGSGGRRRLPEYRRRRCFHCRKSQLQAISSMAKRSGSVFRHVRRTGVFHAVICRMAGQTDSFSRISIRLSALASTGFRNFLRASSSPSPRRHQSRPSSRMETGE